MFSTPITMVRESDLPFDILVTLDGAPLPLTGGTLYFTAKWAPTDADASAVFQRSSPSSGITFINAAGGTANVSIVKANTTTLPYHDTELYYDLKFIDASGHPWTVLRGKLLVQVNITRT